MRKNILFRSAALFSIIMGGAFLFTNTIFAQGDMGEQLPPLDILSHEVEGEDVVMADEEEILLLPDVAAALGGEGLMVEESVLYVAEKPLVPENTSEAITEVVVPILPPPAVAPGEKKDEAAAPAVPVSVLPKKPVVPLPPTMNPSILEPAEQTAAPVQAVYTQVAAPTMENVVYSRECRIPTGFFRNRMASRNGSVESYPVNVGGRNNGFGRSDYSRQPMIDPYYTLRGPRHFDDPNPPSIGP